jgi:hypothetical protein
MAPVAATPCTGAVRLDEHGKLRQAVSIHRLDEVLNVKIAGTRQRPIVFTILA